MGPNYLCPDIILGSLGGSLGKPRTGHFARPFKPRANDDPLGQIARFAIQHGFHAVAKFTVWVPRCSG